jgi:hypothetical protein
VIPVKVSRDWVDKAGVILAALTLVMLTVYTGYSRKQWLALEATLSTARDQVAEAREANRIARQAIGQALANLAEENRAWVATKDSRLDLSVGKQPSIIETLTNSGKTPALNVIVRGGCGYGPGYSQDHPPALGTPLPPRSILPNLDIAIPCVTNNPIPQTAIDAIRNGTVPFIYVGTISYTDRFGGKSHLTKFCLFFDHTVDRMGFCNSPGSNYAD